MFLRCKERRKDGKTHHYWSVVENRRVSSGRVVQRHVLYLGELNGTQKASWQKTITLFDNDGTLPPRQAALFPETHLPLEAEVQPGIPTIGIQLSRMRLERPRQRGARWLASPARILKVIHPPQRMINASSVIPATSEVSAFKWSSHLCKPPMVFQSPTKCSRAIPPIRQRCGCSLKRSKHNMAKHSGRGSWIDVALLHPCGAACGSLSPFGRLRHSNRRSA